jgi:hypothetical protein
MKTFLLKTFLITLFVFASLSTFLYAQDLSLNTISNARLTIELKGKTAYCTTNEKGEFAISLSDTSKTFINTSFISANIKVEIPNFNKKIFNTNFTIKLEKEKAPYYEYVLSYKKGKNIDEIDLVCKEIPTIKSLPHGWVQRGQAGKHGDKYVGQVAHF